jgi:hypothetical protein
MLYTWPNLTILLTLEDTSMLMAGGTYGISSMSEVVGEIGLEMGSWEFMWTWKHTTGFYHSTPMVLN